MAEYQDGVSTGDIPGETINNVRDVIHAMESNLNKGDDHSRELGALMHHFDRESDTHKDATELGLNIIQDISSINLSNMEDGAKVYVEEIGTAVKKDSGSGNLIIMGEGRIDSTAKSDLPDADKFKQGEVLLTGDARAFEVTT